MRIAYTVLIGKSQTKRPVVRSIHIWEVGIKIGLGGIGCEEVG
jgi:hypothetical protein